jgi:ABC-type transport system substrate-binding protein
LSAEEWNSRVQERRDFDMIVDGLGIGPDPVLFEEVLVSDNVLNVGSYRNAELDELFRQGKAALTQEARAEAYRGAQAVIAEDLPRIHLLLHGHHLGYTTRWRGWSWDPAVRGTLPAWSLESVALPDDVARHEN